jgi:nicotinamide riboside kinase
VAATDAMTARVIALVGAESTGKTALSTGLRDALASASRRVVVVSEYLREFCDREGRVPRRHEQPHIAAEQSLRIARAARECDLVVADTTALMTAVYSDLRFGDASLFEPARRDHDGCELTLLTGLDLDLDRRDWQRDSNWPRAAADAHIRHWLDTWGTVYATVYGTGQARLGAALAAVQRAWDAASPDDARTAVRWQSHCERCGDPHCERHPLTRGLGRRTPPQP